MNDIKSILLKLKQYKPIYVIGHNSLDADSFFSSYILSKILNKLGINAKFTILDNYTYSDEDLEIINDYKKEEPFLLPTSHVDNKNFIIVDHNDIEQSLKNNKCNILLSIDHHIDTKKVKTCYSDKYTSTLLYIYDLFKEIYEFSYEEKVLIAITVICDSLYLTSTRFSEKDKKLYKELNIDLDINKFRKKYFKTTDFNLNLNEFIKTNSKAYNINNININRIIVRAYKKDKKNIYLFLKEIEKENNNYLIIWNEFDTNKTYIYYNQNLVKEYNYILTSTVMIIKDLIDNKLII